MTNSEARERVIVAAERLFIEKGYAAVTVKDIAKAAKIHHSSIYHHLPERDGKSGGKQELFIEVMERNLSRHKKAVQQAITENRGNLREQLSRIAAWLLTQPPMDFIRMAHSDMPALDDDAAERLSIMAYDALFVPLEAALMAAQTRGEIRHRNMGNMAGAVFSAIEGLHALPEDYLEVPKHDMALEIIDVFIKGLSVEA